MTGPPSGGTERSTRTPSRSAGIPGAVVAIALVLAFGLALRFIIAYSLLPGSGFITDVNTFRAWASDLAGGGLGGFYERAGFIDYTPGYMYVLWLVGTVGNGVGGIGDLIKLPPILADAAIGWLVWSMARELGARQGVALLGAAFAVINPVSWFDSAVWGQVDSFGVVFLLLALRELWRDRPERAAILTVVAAVIKPQLGILVPLVAIVTIRRAIWPRGGYGDDPAPNPVDTREADPGAGLRERLLGWERRTDRPVRILTTATAGFLTAVILSAPFGLSVIEVSGEAPFVGSGLLEQVGKAAGGYPYTTVNAFNPWALIPGDAGYSLAQDGLWICDTDAVDPNASGGDRCSSGTLMFGPVSALTVGTSLLLASFALVLFYVGRHPDRRTLLVGLAILAMVFFVVPTRVHERYMFPFFALAAILAAVSVRWRIAYVVLTAATFANMYVVLTTLFDHSAVGVVDWLGIGETLRDQASVTLVAMAHLVGFAWAFAQLRGDNRERLADEIAEAGVRDAWPARASEAGPPPPATELPAATAEETAPVTARASASAPAAASPGPAPGWHASADGAAGDELAQVGLLPWLRDRLAARSIRADRTALLVGEGGGRLDRLDVWLLIVLVVATLGLRTFRLSEPQHFHFDEVHHVQTAAEFLQAWRYGESQDIYEWTHPHLGKYAIAAGIALFGDDRVSATSSIGTPVRDALTEPRRADPFGGDEIGDRVYLATDDGVRIHDLGSRALVATVEIPGATRLAIDLSLNQLLVGTADGEILAVDLAGATDEGGEPFFEPFPSGAVDGAVDTLRVTGDGTTILAASGDTLSVIDRDSGQTLATTEVAGLRDVAEAGTGAALVATPADVEDPGAAAALLADLLDGTPGDYEAQLLAADTSIIVAGLPDGDVRTEIEEAIAAGDLAGFEVTEVSRVVAAAADGLVFLDQSTGTELERLELSGGAHGIASVTVDDPQLYVTSGTAAEPTFSVVTMSGENEEIVLDSTNPLPGLGTRVDFNESSRQVHILGAAPDGDGWTEYVIEPNSKAVYADARLPFEPAALALDVDAQHPSTDRQQLLAFAADAAGSAATVEIGQHAFAWRLPGVIAGALMAGLIFLLARILFRRREVAVLAGVFVLVDGMLFAHSRIGMIDAVLGMFMVAAYLLFAGLWTGRWRRPWAFWALLPVIGLLLGLALATKWIAAYAIGAVVLLMLARSALGRLVLIGGLIAITVVLGYMAISVGEDQGGLGNFSFLLVMIALTLVAVVATVLHPIAWSDDEFRLAVLGPAALGVVVFFGSLAIGRLDSRVAFGAVDVSPLEVAILLTLLAPAIYGAFRLVARYGFGPLAAPPAPDDPVRLLEPPAPPPTGWLRPGWGLGLPLAWAALSLVVIPVAVYVVSYLPWAAIENHQLWPGFPAGHTGQTLVELTGQMYRYHDQLTSAHAASSPWWAWPLNLKPVWFYQEGFDSGVTGSIYDAGNLVIWWLGIPAMLFVAWQAFRRRSLALGLIAIAFAAQWVPWARIDRAAFQYHYYTALPFVILALAYFAAELWHGPSRRTWMLAKASAAVAIVFPALLHVLSRPLCWVVGVEAGAACPEQIPSFVLTDQTAGLAIVLGVGFLLILRGLNGLGRGDGIQGSFVSLALTAAGVALGLVIVAGLPGGELLHIEAIPVEPIALVVAIPLGYLALQVLGARDPRRFVGGLVVAVVATFAVFYPNLSGLPLPSAVVNAYQGILPTYLYYFQFPVNETPRNASTPLLTPMFGVLAVALVVTCVVVAYSAWSWRMALAERGETDEAREARAASPG